MTRDDGPWTPEEIPGMVVSLLSLKTKIINGEYFSHADIRNGLNMISAISGLGFSPRELGVSQRHIGLNKRQLAGWVCPCGYDFCPMVDGFTTMAESARRSE